MNTEISIEFFPPQTPEGVEKLRTVRAELAKLKPEFFSVTYGAGGSTRERTFAVVKEIAAEGFDAAPHLSCIGSSRESIREILAEYKAAGIKRTVALRGDLPSGMAEAGEFRYANELVEFIRAETGDWFSIEVAAYPEWHPQARSPKDDLEAFARKVKAGANSAITQYFYNADAYFHFVDEAGRSASMCRSFPASCPSPASPSWPASPTPAARNCRAGCARSSSFGDDAESIRAFGLDVVTELCERLLKGGAPGLHFYAMNQAALTTEICRRLG
jgi:methylenetetrahydrofolate reductase (NADPH)